MKDTRELFDVVSSRRNRAVKNGVGVQIIFSPARREHMFRRISGSVSFIGLTLAVAFLDTGQLANFGNVFIRRYCPVVIELHTPREIRNLRCREINPSPSVHPGL